MPGMNLDQDPKQVAIYLSRARAVLGLVMLVAPGLAGRAVFGPAGATSTARALSRMAGVRDLVLGVGTLTALNETDHGPDWLGMCAAADAGDALALLLGPGLTARARLAGLSAVAASGASLVLSRRLADARL
jgi:hypothetical protein